MSRTPRSRLKRVETHVQVLNAHPPLRPRRDGCWGPARCWGCTKERLSSQLPLQWPSPCPSIELVLRQRFTFAASPRAPCQPPRIRLTPPHLNWVGINVSWVDTSAERLRVPPAATGHADLDPEVETAMPCRACAPMWPTSRIPPSRRRQRRGRCARAGRRLR